MTIYPVAGKVPQWSQGNRLQKAREELGLDRGAFAIRLGVDRNTVMRYEKDRVSPREIVLRAWARETEVDLEWLRTGVPTTPAPQPLREQASTLAQRLVLSREEAGLERLELALALGVDRGTLGRYESGQSAPRMVVLKSWAAATGVDSEWLRTGVLSVPAATSGGGRFLVLVEAQESGVCSVSTRIRNRIRTTRTEFAA